MKDKIKWFSNENGNGFIEYNGENVIIHCSTNEGEHIELELIETENGYELKNKDRN